MVLSADPGQCSRSNLLFVVQVDTNCPDLQLTCIPPSGATFNLGTTLVTCVATNLAGDSNSCSFPITVVPSPAGPVVLMGIDAEDRIRSSSHGPISTWQTLGSNIIRQAGGGSGILVIGGGKNPTDDVTWFWRAIGTSTLQTVTFVNGSNAIATQSFAGFRMIGIASDIHQTLSGGLRIPENDALRTRAADIANFVNHGGALWGLGSLFTNSATSAGPYPYVAGLGGVVMQSVTYSNIEPTAAGAAIGIDATLNLNLRGSFWHQTFQVYPKFMQSLCYMANTTNAAAIGGAQVQIPMSCPNPVTIPCSDFVTLTAQVYNAECSGLEVVWRVDGVTMQTNFVPPNVSWLEVTHTHWFGPGQHIVRLTQRGVSFTNSCETLVTADAPPVLVCPNVQTNTEPGQCSARVSFTLSAWDLCSPTTYVVCSPASGSTFAVGSTWVTCTAWDGEGNSANCTFRVTVEDAEPPVMVCPANIVTNAAPGACQAVVTYAPLVIDNCSGSYSCQPPSGSVFGNGTTPVLCVAQDIAGHSNTCSFTVTVLDDGPPILLCPGDIITNAAAGNCEVRVDYGVLVNDNCPGSTVVCQPPSGSSFGSGVTPIRCVGTDAAGQTNACSFNVQVSGSLSIQALPDQAVCAGTPVTFNAIPAESNGIYRWRLDGQLQAANGPELALNTGSFPGNHLVEVSVSNACGQASRSAVLTVGTPLSAPPLTNLVRCPCEGANFAAEVSGVGPIAFAWRLNGQLLPGQTNSTLSLPALKASDAGLYNVEMTGLCNSITQSASLVLEGVYPNPATFSNPARIAIRDFTSASPYPSSVQVHCLPGPATNLSVALFGLAHSYPGDIDMLLVNPLGQKLRLMSDTGNQPTTATNLTLIFDDAAPSDLPNNSRFVSDTYRPTNYDPSGETSDQFPPPVPAGGYASRLADLTGHADGPWSLYVVDDTQADQGVIAGGWSLSVWWDAAGPVLTSAWLGSGGQIEMHIQSLPGQPHVIESSADLEHWTVLHRYVPAEETYSFIADSSTIGGAQFFRVLRCP